jgi:hypothetical protein
MAEQWKIDGDFIDFCKCAVPCPCSWGRPPTEGDCEGVIGYRIREGTYGEVKLDGLNAVGLSYFEGNIWEDGVKMKAGFILDEAADEEQREALQAIFGGQAGSWPAVFAKDMLGEMRGIEFAPINLEIADDSSSWSLEVNGKATGKAKVLTGPTSRPGANVEVVNIPGAEPGPNSGPTTYGTGDFKGSEFGFDFEFEGRSAKHIPFEWSSEDEF